jgi:hypothetical protein
VADIEGASPSVASDKSKNVARGRNYLEQAASRNDVLGQYEKIFNLKQLSTGAGQNGASLGSQSSVFATPVRYNPTFVSSFALHQ